MFNMKINVFEASFSQIQISLCMSFRSEVMVRLSPGHSGKPDIDVFG